MYKQSYYKKPPQSYWMASTPKTNYPELTENIDVDVAIIGGGITGISCGYELVKSGVKTAIVEADHILRGTTGHTTAKITSQHGLIYNKIGKEMSKELAQQYADANQLAIRHIHKTLTELNINCDYTSQSAYVFTEQNDYISKIEQEVKTALEVGIEAEYIEKIPFNIPIKAAIRFNNQAQFHPLKYLLALADEVVDRGGSIYEQTRAVDIEENKNYIISTKQGKKITAEKIIIASHYPFYNKEALYFSRIYSERSYVLAIKAKEKYPGGMYITAEEPGRSLRNQKTDKGELILVGGEHHKTGQGIDTIKHNEALMSFSDNLFTVEDIPFRWSTQDCMTLDGVPYIGHYTSKKPNMYIATGYGKWGMTNSTVSSIIIKDLITTGKSQWQEVYNPSRHTITASSKNFIMENMNVAKELIEGKIKPLPDNIEVNPGEAKVIKSKGQRIGAYRDEQGKLHLVNTTCPHMGCELNWNSAEKSWDCPCHASRFTYEGEIIEGPAIEPINTRKDVNTISKLFKDKF